MPGSSVHGILQARILEWVAISSPGDPPNRGIEPGTPTLQADFLPSELQYTANISAIADCFLQTSSELSLKIWVSVAVP